MYIGAYGKSYVSSPLYPRKVLLMYIGAFRRSSCAVSHVSHRVSFCALNNYKRNTGKAIRKAEEQPVGYEKWRAPSISDVIDNQSDNH